MGDQSSIEWTDASWNPIRGCSRVSEGCRNCYAERVAARFSGEGMPFERVSGGRNWTGIVEFVEHALDLPLRWKRPRRIFVNSMSDLFHEKVAEEWIDRIFAVMALCPQHTFQVLTKRPERMRAYVTSVIEDRIRFTRWAAIGADVARTVNRECEAPPRWPLPNVHLGVSVEHQAAADERIPLLLQTPAAVRFLSVEPLLGPVDLTWIGHDDDDRDGVIDALRGQDWIIPPEQMGSWDRTNRHVTATGPRLDWIIAGGESGPDARTCDLAWIRSIVAQAKAAGVPCFVKQLGARPVTHHYDVLYQHVCDDVSAPHALALRDRKGGDPVEWPEDLRVREFPA